MKPNKNISMKDMEGEKWTDCPGYDGWYEVSNMGRVKSVYRVITKSNGVEMVIKPRILKQELKNKSKGKKSYARVCLCYVGIESNIAVHKLMADAGVKLKKKR
ncbi:MAG: hypothetical protein JJE25_06705 [Bacteroidia bacterium]|nr:hypothetical protein [Bacteroidia bacterium]